ncbi:MAG: hypothetical protein ACR2NZ_05285 [Rubripirellula sp.]
MKKFALLLVVAGSLGTLSFTGCGSGDTAVIENTDPQANQMQADQQAQYEEQMKNYGTRQSGSN